MNALGVDHYVMTYVGLPVMTVVAVEDNTTVEITFPTRITSYKTSLHASTLEKTEQSISDVFNRSVNIYIYI